MVASNDRVLVGRAQPAVAVPVWPVVATEEQTQVAGGTTVGVRIGVDPEQHSVGMNVDYLGSFDVLYYTR